MKTKSFYYAFTLSALLLTMSLGCKKDSAITTEEDTYQAVTEDAARMENVSTDIDNMTSQVSRRGFSPVDPSDMTMDQYNLRSCANVTNDTINHVLTFDFGTGCTGRDGRVRSGRMIVNYTGNGYFDPGASWTVTFDSFYVDQRHIEGTRTVTNNGLNAAGNMTWSIVATNMRITKADGTWRNWDSQRTREMIAGYGDSLWVNDVYLINGTANSTNSNGQTASSVMTNLRRQHDCHYITSGILTITPSNRPARTIDFGNGVCDDLATVTVSGASRTIHLRW